MSDRVAETVHKQLADIRARMAEAFGKKPCKIEMTVDQAICVNLLIEKALEQGVDEALKPMLEMAHMYIQRGLDDVK